MRVYLVAAFVMVLLLPVLPPAAASAPAPNGTPDLAGDLTISIHCWFYANESYCTYSVTSSNPAVIFFRWDFNGDGVWDFPNQTGAGPIGRWTTLLSVTWTPGGYLRVCVQGWDGVSTRTENGHLVPDALLSCTDSLSMGFLRQPHPRSGSPIGLSTVASCARTHGIRPRAAAAK